MTTLVKQCGYTVLSGPLLFTYNHSSRYDNFLSQKVLIFFLFLSENIFCGYSLEVLLMSTHNICFTEENKQKYLSEPSCSKVNEAVS